MSQKSSEHKANRLINEKSPYLLQHAYNPVDWYAWGKEAFEKARRENRPIFLSIGYSSCHWCHVLAHESFEDPDVAKLLNESFVCIKVDREERPDVDEIYMKALVAMTGSGGWPLSVFLTPSLEPFYGGTYFPPTPRNGMPSFSNVIRNVSSSWKSDRKKIIQSGSEMKKVLREMYETVRSSGSELNDSPLDDCYASLVSLYDERFGGFGDAPKFPTPSNLFFLTRYHQRKKNDLALSMVTKTLASMRDGGIFDQVGGGFHRYSTDRYWIVPHFEKMLYDNALLVQAYSENYLITTNADSARIIRETLGWVLREMRDLSGGFYCAQDADSPDGEGSYYVWTKKEFDRVLSLDDEIEQRLKIVTDYFSITNEGNFENGANILTAKRLSEVAAKYEIKEEELRDLISKSKNLLLEERVKRPKPPTDDKILCSWNGLMISSLCKAYQTLGDREYLQAAISAADFVLAKLSNADSAGTITLLRIFRSGESKGEGLLEDYSYVINGLIDLYESGFDPRYLETAISLCGTMISKFHDSAEGGFYQTGIDVTNLIARPKDAFDGALPSGNSMAALATARLAEITLREDFKKVAIDTILAFWDHIMRQPQSFTQLLVALDFSLGPSREVVISGERDSQAFVDLLEVIRGKFLPRAVIVLADEKLMQISPLVEGRIAKEAEDPRVYVCSNFSCNLPSRTREELETALAS